MNNVVVTPTQADVRGVYERARVFLAPSLCWEVGGRVVAEAAINGIPSLITDRGGLPETAGDGGLRLTLPEAFYESPYDKRLSDAAVTAVVGRLTRLYEDPAYYQQLSDKAHMQARQKHGLAANTDRLERVLRAALRG